jgi:hypothetical protein
MGLSAALQVQGGARRFAHAYYVCNALMFASYVPLRRLMAEPAAVEGVNARLFGYVRARARTSRAWDADPRCRVRAHRSARRLS